LKDSAFACLGLVELRVLLMMEKFDVSPLTVQAGSVSEQPAIWPKSTRSAYHADGEPLSAWVSNTGLVRAHNEDSCYSNDELGLYVLADGMGGYNAGEVASKLAVDEFRLRVPERYMTSADASQKEGLLVEATTLANKSILKTAKTRPECLGMGTTLVAVLIGSNRPSTGASSAGGMSVNASIAHIGDSRAYFYANAASRLSVLTKDHSVGQELVDRGAMTPADLLKFPMRGVLTRALGVEPDISVDTMSLNIADGDILLLCSDGLSDMLGLADMQSICEKHFKKTSKTACFDAADELVCMALKRGGTDNVSAMLISPGLRADIFASRTLEK
jgi:PPM family protein phosphatase